MKRLYLLRHAQALPSSPDGDKGRKLSPRGVEDAQALANMMAKFGYSPDVILCSSAVRTRETCQALLSALGDIPVSLKDTLYNAPTDTLLGAAQDLDDAHAAALLLAHNPGIHDLAARLSSEDSNISHLGRLMEGYAPAALSVLDCPVESWADLAVYHNMLVDLQDPLDYNAPATPARWT